MSASARERGTTKRIALLGCSVIGPLVTELLETLGSLNTVRVR